MVRLIWECKECESIVTSYSDKVHELNYCTCGCSGVDLTEYYQRNLGQVREIERAIKTYGVWKVIKNEKNG